MHEGMIHRLIGVFDQAFSQLDVRVGPDRLEDLAVLIHKAMTVQARNYHNLEHVFSFVDPQNPIQTLAALFHDIVYYQVDLGFLPEIRRIISPYVHEKDGVISLAQQIPDTDRLFWQALDIFGLRDRVVITPGMGVNEFLSAVVMNRKMDRILQERDLLKMMLCIEATIPFRGPSPSGESHFEILARRARLVSETWGLEVGEEELDQAVMVAVRFANKDVEGFAEEDPGKFLEGTWKLLPEMNIPLRSRDVYSIREYRRAIQSMEASLGALDPNNVFHNYRGVPPQAEFERMVGRAQENIQTARAYLRIKLLAQAILEALALETGGDAPLSLFMGDLPHAFESVQRLEDFLPDLPVPDWVDRSSTLYLLLDSGRKGDVSFDLTTAPLSLFVYKSLPLADLDRSLLLAQEMFAGRLSPHDFLLQIDRKLVGAIARASAGMVLTRSAQLKKYSF